MQDCWCELNLSVRGITVAPLCGAKGLFALGVCLRILLSPTPPMCPKPLYANSF